MKASLHDYMKVGLIHFMAYPQTIGGDGPVFDTMAEVVRDEYFECIEITRVNDPDEAARVRDLLASSGMAVGFGAQPIELRGGLNLNSFDDEERCRAIEALKGAVDSAYYFGAKKLGFLSGKKPAERQDDALQLLADAIIEVGQYARSKGDLVLSLETFDDSTDKKALIGTNRLAAELSKEVRKQLPDFGLMIDLSHLPMQGETVREALTVAADQINHAHIGTCVISDPNDPLYGDKHPRFLHPKSENGVPEVREYLAGLFDIGYLTEDAPERNIVSFEVMPAPGTFETSQSVVAEAKRVLREAWRTL
ncbi:sugar phosphate isomerase/epimerase family protein [Raineyella fluvialis]|uniref:TIM barrel protein n=1 Tax=Raineyella fluvialis TaxID=2662261 RepID=A0A5Q2FAG1_9ACTN|nr:TIM barrel protein [Raineyella fluvialis]QGF23361.1 TIM barrel protein [Raineyella fluvialis]